MIKTLYNIGQLLKDKESDWFRPWKDPFAGKDESDKIVIIIEIKDKKILDEPIFEAYKKSNVNKYLFREAKSNATNLVPTFYYQVFTDKEKQRTEIEKKIKKIKASINNYKHNFIEKNEIDRIKPILSVLQLDSKKRYLLTFTLDGKYFGEFEKYKTLFYNDAYKKYSNASRAKSKVCAVTYTTTDEVWGRVNTLGFAVTDQAFERNGFNTVDSYKMFPVSKEAVKILDGTKDFVINNLSRGFSKLNYFILPHFINIKKNLQEEILNDFLIIARQKDTSLQDESKSIIGNENLIFEIIKDEKLCKSRIYYDLLFYQQNNAQFLIKLHLSDILPSQFTKIFKVKKVIENRYDIITRWENIDKSIEYHYFINLRNIKDFFSEIKQKEVIFHPYFFKVIEAVFYNSFLNVETVLKFMLKKIIGDFKKRNENPFLFSQDFKKSLIIYKFFSQLGLFTNKNQDNMEENSFVALTMDEFIEQHKSLLDTDYAKGTFMLGCLVKKLLKIQYASLGSTPFDKRLNNLTLNNDELQRIFRETKAKLIQYRIAYTDLETVAFSLLADQNKAAKLTRDKISYLFSGGLVMEDEFAKEAKRRRDVEKQKEESDNNSKN